jgi:hypothetical protein
MADRVEVLEADMCSAEGKKALQDADVVVLHNVFEFFGDVAEVERCWAAVRAAVCRRGQRLLVIPSLPESLQAVPSQVRPRHRLASRPHSPSLLLLPGPAFPSLPPCGMTKLPQWKSSEARGLGEGNRPTSGLPLV